MPAIINRCINNLFDRYRRISGVSFAAASFAAHHESRSSSTQRPRCFKIFSMGLISVINETILISCRHSGQIKGSSFQIFFMHSLHVSEGEFLERYFETSRILSSRVLLSFRKLSAIASDLALKPLETFHSAC